MPFDFGSALSKERTLHTEIKLEGMDDLLPLDYYPNRVDQAAQAMNDLDYGDPALYSKLEKLFLSLVASWEASANGQPVPLTPEGMAAAGMTSPFLVIVIRAILRETYAGEASGTRLRRR